MTPTLRTARGNRIGLAIVGVLLVVAGLAVLAVGRGDIGASSNQHADLLTGAETRWVAARDWVWLVIGAIGAVVTLVCLRWLMVQARRDRLDAIQLEADRRTGTTWVPTGLVADAVADEIEEYPGVRSASATFVGTGTAPGLRLAVSLRERADLDGVCARIEQEAAAHAAEALGTGWLPLQLVFRLDVAPAV